MISNRHAKIDDVLESPLGQPKYNNLWGRPGYLIRRLHQIHVGLFAEECNSKEFTAVQYAVLSVLYNGDQFDQHTLSKAVGIDRTSGADVFKRLVRRGLVSREPSEQDRRAKVVRITEEGRELVRGMRPAMERAQEKLLAPLSEDEQGQFMDFIRRLVEANNDASRAPMA
ncbi:MarR family transcriptional regulator [Rhodospirillaceae bacterium KN72]|uniref:MarR family transcriptional regulator n=1 Tax=Pacificispira spongiicola TaxID=2729598 RepID=A0A7Y0DXH1_9PROT|nr:MarR family transcriptional regulator [Pacificispira spongiicola]NMM43405.1 MarR family transcriptional regulator [Pacificispira spongiicola]